MKSPKGTGNDPKILDVTLRDGGCFVDHSFTIKQTREITGILDEAGIEYLELGCGLGAKRLGFKAAFHDVEYAKAAKESVKNAKIGVITPHDLATSDDIDEIREYIDFIRVTVFIDNVPPAEKIITMTKKRGLLAFVQMMSSASVDEKHVGRSAKIAEDMGADAVHIVDSTGSFMPDQIPAYVNEVRSKCRLPIGFHGHDNLHMALANSIAAIDAGCDWIDASLRGIGRGAGNAQLETLVILMQGKELFKNIDLDALFLASENLVAPIDPKIRGVSEDEIVVADAKLLLVPLSLYKHIALQLGLSLKDFLKEFSGVVQVKEEHLRKAILKHGGDPDKMFHSIAYSQ